MCASGLEGSSVLGNTGFYSFAVFTWSAKEPTPAIDLLGEVAVFFVVPIGYELSFCDFFNPSLIPVFILRAAEAIGVDLEACDDVVLVTAALCWRDGGLFGAAALLAGL